MRNVIQVENLSKQYRLGAIGTRTISHDLNRFWYKARGKEDPYLKIGEENDRTRKGATEYIWALKDVNFGVKTGEVVGIIGRNGAGKSTLLKILSRTTVPTAGKVKMKGRVASLLEVGTGFHPELTGRENIFLNGAILGMTKKEIKSRFDEIVDFSGVERYLETPVKRYSSGMYIRLAFGVAAHLESEILIVDEVLAVGDSEFQKKCLGRMKSVSQNEGKTVLFVSHNLQAISAICERGIVIENGRLFSNGTMSNAISDYFNISRSFILNNDTAKKDRLSRTSGKIQFTSIVCMKDEKKNELWTYSYNEEVQLQIECKANEDCDGLTFYMAFKGLLSDAIITNLKFLITEETVIKNRKITFSVLFPPKAIRAGQYDLYFALADRNARNWYDVVDSNVNLPALIIMPVSADPHDNIGFFGIPFSIKVT